MSLRWLALLLPLYSVSVHALEMPIEIVEIVDNTRVVAFINESDIDNFADWKPFESTPALNVTDAVVSVKKFITENDGLKEAQVEEIVLRQIPHHEGRWHYMVKLKTERDEQVSYHYLVVLMNGKIIPAIREPSSIK